MAGTMTAVMRTLEAPALDAQVQNTRTDARRFAMLAIPLALLLVAFKVYGLEQPPFFTLACLAFGGFGVSYWLPFRYKRTFTISLSLAGAYVLLSPLAASLLIVVGLLLFGIVRSSFGFWWKVVAILAILAVSAYGRTTGRFPVPRGFWPVLAAVFMFRTIAYLYDVKHLKEPVRLTEHLSYFFLLPNYYFLLFPVIDFQTFRKSYYKRDMHLVAQQGIWWIFRGTTHLLLYRLIYQLLPKWTPPTVPVALAVAGKIVFTYLLYLRISGQFHIIAGMLHLFGFDLPETNRRYLLASSLNDFWRRSNIYWKDFMVKCFYFPAYFKMRKSGELRAQLLATMLVFVVTWFLHAYQFFWLQGVFRVTLNDSLFWIVLGSVVMAEVWIQHKRGRRAPKTGWAATLQNALHVAVTFTFIALLWSMWSSESLTEWFDFLRGANV